MTIMIRPKGKAEKIAKKVMRSQGIKIPKSKPVEKPKVQGPYLLH